MLHPLESEVIIKYDDGHLNVQDRCLFSIKMSSDFVRRVEMKKDEDDELCIKIKLSAGNFYLFFKQSERDSLVGNPPCSCKGG